MHSSVPVKRYSDLVIVHLRQQVTALTRVFLGDGWQMSVTRVVNVRKKRSLFDRGSWHPVYSRK